MTASDFGEPFVRAAGEGPGVVCIHANASTSSQWRPLIDRLSPRYRVLAPDTLGSGKSPAWPTDRVVTLSDEAAFLEPVFANARDPFALVGHSYGGAVALVAALSHAERISSLVLYEPTLFSLLEEESPGQDAFTKIFAVADAAHDDVKAGAFDRAAERFIDFWMGPGAFAGMPESLRAPVAASMLNIGGWAEALRSEPAPLDAFRGLEIPTLYLVGERSPGSSREVARLLTSALPRVEVRELEGLGHMAPVTHPSPVNDLIEEFLDRSRPR